MILARHVARKQDSGPAVVMRPDHSAIRSGNIHQPLSVYLGLQTGLPFSLFPLISKKSRLMTSSCCLPDPYFFTLLCGSCRIKGNYAIPCSQNCFYRTPWPDSVSEIYRPSERRLLETLVPTLAGRWVPRGQRDGSLWPYFSVF
jgi:hypothetical protein